ncbi:hypothetical protein [Ferrimonas marina]|uniref:Uncharacterized protein n=1 Tax=Ferrimonas marina TaxID=299255 RepID=A0A1M5TSM5_9GAMM|nr:hypothetical protein [Ferrimonas marina]SHH53660.1 hypothetical protein SAMN02745129_2260 [Ferrimonas marina]
MREWIHNWAERIFLVTLIGYGLLIYFLDYVGVKITYTAVPIIAVSLFVAYVTRPRTSDRDQNDRR